MRPSSTCVCKHIRPVKTNCRFIILMHPKEYKKEKNGTGHMTGLQLENSEIFVDVDFTDHKRVNEILNDENSTSFLMYPGKDNFNLSVQDGEATKGFLGENANIFILDGTWPCARKMLKLSKNLQALKRVSFDNEITSKFIIKQQPEALCLSTIESVYTVINILNESGVEDCDTNHFLLPFEKMIESQVHYILNPNPNGYRPNLSKELTPKTRYKKNPQRSVMFEGEKSGGRSK
jgi:tRNA-uridine aminocarboxypropyltransferase